MRHAAEDREVLAKLGQFLQVRRKLIVTIGLCRKEFIRQQAEIIADRKHPFGSFRFGALRKSGHHRFLLAFKIEIHCWRPIDALFRTITARRNPNMILLTVGTLGGRPDLGLLMVAIWTVVSLGFHSERFLQALWERSRGDRISSWDEASQQDPGADNTRLDPGTVA